MSDQCATCDCSNKSQCTKKGYVADIIVTEISYDETPMMDTPAAENDGKCKCGSGCACSTTSTCACGH